VSTIAAVTVVDENGAGLQAPLTAKLTDISGLFDYDLGAAQLMAGGFSIGPYSDDILAGAYGPRRLRLNVYNGTRAVIAPIEKDDTSAAALDFGKITIPQRDASGWAVTLGRPVAQAIPFLSHNNAVRILVDSEEAWGYLSDRLATADELNIMQLELDVPKHDEPGIVLKFSPALTATNLRAIGTSDSLLEDQIKQIAAKPATHVRILMDDGSWTNVLVIVGEAVLLLIVLPLTLVMALINIKTLAYAAGKALDHILHSHPDGGADDVKNYFKKAAPAPKILGFTRTLWNRIHAKIALMDPTTDKAEVILLGSPFEQSYFDASTHAIDEPRRGWRPDVPIHDVSVGVRGPAIDDVHETFRKHWNKANGSEDVAAINPVGAATPGTGEFAASLQLIRTINGGVFTELPDGEQGILEAYLRAIENAKDFVYFENQYFTDDAIVKALIAALKAKSDLRAILVVNVIPDIPFYAKWQCAAIDDIRKQLGTNADHIGFFTLWSQEAGKIMPNYVHAKVGIVGNDWATVGSANLDGASLDYFQLFHLLQFGSNRNHELNYTIFNKADGLPASDAVEALRRRLWSEHLGYADPASHDLDLTGSGDGDRLLTLWRNSSKTKIDSLKNSPASAPPAGTGRAIEYPSKTTWNFKEYLTNWGITVDGKSLALVENSRPFSFKKGAWIK
jgi:phosphatidylserine/phosphatidylglycerophosphate/cardiolipin synthase-like enzyme